MATYDAEYKARIRAMLHGVNMTEVFTWPEAATQTFVKQDLVYLSSGYVTVCGTNPSVIAGLAMQDGNDDTSDGDHDTEVGVLTGLTLLAMEVHSGTPANADIEAADLGASYGITAVSNAWYVDKDKTGGDARVKIVDFIDPVGTVNGRVLVQVLAANRMFA